MGTIRQDESLEIHNCVDVAMNRLVEIWNEIGIVDTQRLDRIGIVSHHVRILLDEMVQEENSLKARLTENVDKFGIELFHLCKDLSLPPHVPKNGFTLLQLEKDLRLRVESLTKDKQNRMKRFQELTETDELLCSRLTAKPFHISSTVPTPEELDELEKHIQELEMEQNCRMKKFSIARESICKMLDDLELSPVSTFQQSVVNYEDDFCPTIENISALKSYQLELENLIYENRTVLEKLWGEVRLLWKLLEHPLEECSKFESIHQKLSHRTILAVSEELQRCRELKKANVERVTLAVRKELIDWWNKCYILQEQRDLFKPFHSDSFTDDLLEAHENELKYLKEYYKDNEEMLSKISKRQQLWGEFLELERKAQDPDRFSNRGGNLLKEEKARKKLAIDLPKIEVDLFAQIKNWETKMNRKFLICGMSFEEFVKKQRNDYMADKENEKFQRDSQKAKQTELELMFGSKPSTPGKRRFNGNTPTKTPNKTRKLDTLLKSPLLTPKGNRNICSPVSVSGSLSAEKADFVSQCNLARNLKTPCCFKETTDTRPELNRASSTAIFDLSHSTTIVAPSSNPPGSETNISSVSLFSDYDDFVVNLPAKANIRSTMGPKEKITNL